MKTLCTSQGDEALKRFPGLAPGLWNEYHPVCRDRTRHAWFKFQIHNNSTKQGKMKACNQNLQKQASKLVENRKWDLSKFKIHSWTMLSSQLLKCMETEQLRFGHYNFPFYKFRENPWFSRHENHSLPLSPLHVVFIIHYDEQYSYFWLRYDISKYINFFLLFPSRS